MRWERRNRHHSSPSYVDHVHSDKTPLADPHTRVSLFVRVITSTTVTWCRVIGRPPVRAFSLCHLRPLVRSAASCMAAWWWWCPLAAAAAVAADSAIGKGMVMNCWWGVACCWWWCEEDDDDEEDDPPPVPVPPAETQRVTRVLWGLRTRGIQGLRMHKPANIEHARTHSYLLAARYMDAKDMASWGIVTTAGQ